MSIYFTSDTHFHHKGIITKRRHGWCSDIEDMNAKLIERWNSCVKPDDVVFHLGDLSFAGLNRTADVIKQLNGKIKLVPGNHDDKAMARRLVDMGLIELLPPIYTLKVGTHRFCLCHYPLLNWDRCQHGALHLHGHEHGALTEGPARRTDVGIDSQYGTAPILLETLTDVLYARQGEYVGHHVPGCD